MKLKKLNNKANIPITILVIGIFIVCTFALLSFFISKVHVRESFAGISLMEKINSQIEDYLVYNDLSRVDTKLNSKGESVFYQEKPKSSGSFWWKKEIIVFSVEYAVP